MGILTIKGDIDQLKIIAKTESGRARKYNLLISLEEDKKGDEVPPSDSDPKLTDPQIAELIAKCESLEDLKQYEGDLKQVSGKAYKKKLKEFE